MSQVAPLLRIPVGVVVERRKATSPWADVIWRPVAVLGGLPDAAPWMPLTIDGETATFYAGAAEIELYRSEADNYRSNLASAAPAIWVALQETGGDPPYTVAARLYSPLRLFYRKQCDIECLELGEAICLKTSLFRSRTVKRRPSSSADGCRKLDCARLRLHEGLPNRCVR